MTIDALPLADRSSRASGSYKVDLRCTGADDAAARAAHARRSAAEYWTGNSAWCLELNAAAYWQSIAEARSRRS
jgi:hypothetical protein